MAMTTLVSLLTLMEGMEDAEKCVCVLAKAVAIKNMDARCEYGRGAMVAMMTNVMTKSTTLKPKQSA